MLKPVVVRYQGRNLRRYFRGDAAFASPEIYEHLEAEGFLYAIRLPTNPILQKSIAHLLTRPVGRPPNHVLRFHASFSYQAGSWDRKRRVVATVEWHPGELVPRVGFIITNLSRPAERVVAFYNQRGKAEQYIKEGKHAIKWTRLSCRKFRNNEVRLQLHALANKIALTAWAMMARRTYYQEPVSQGRGSCRTVDLAAESGPYSSRDNRLVSVGGAWRDGCGGSAEQMKGNDDRR